MKTNLLQSQLHHNAKTIVKLTARRITIKAEARAAQMKESRKQLYGDARRLAAGINRLAEIQRDIKRDLTATKFAKLTAAGVKKHGMDDPRYTAHLERQQAAERSGENYQPVEFFPPKASSVSCAC